MSIENKIDEINKNIEKMHETYYSEMDRIRQISFRKKNRLPITKPLKYYGNDVQDIQIVREHKTWSELLILSNGEWSELPIHSRYFAEMQNKDFKPNKGYVSFEMISNKYW